MTTEQALVIIAKWVVAGGVILCTWAITYFLASLVVGHDGPFAVFAKFRYLLGVNVPVVNNQQNPDGEWEEIETGKYKSNGSMTAKIVSCEWCTSVYVAAAVSAIAWFLVYDDQTFWIAPLLWLVTCGAVWFSLDLTTEEE